MERMQKRMREKYGAGKVKAVRKYRTMPRVLTRTTPMYTQPAAGLNRRAVASKETGFVDLGVGSYSADTTGNIALIATVAQGPSVNQRVGKKILWKSIQIRGNMSSNSTTTITDAAWLVVYDRRPTGAIPAITDILVTANSQAFNNDANSGRFKIIRRMDATMIGSSTAPSTGKESRDISEYIKLNGLPAVYKAAGTGAIGDIEEGALYFVTVGSNPTGPAAATVLVGFRTRFIDI